MLLAKYKAQNNNENKVEKEAPEPITPNEVVENTDIETTVDIPKDDLLINQRIMPPDKKIILACSCATVVAVIAVIILILVNKKH